MQRGDDGLSFLQSKQQALMPQQMDVGRTYRPLAAHTSADAVLHYCQGHLLPVANLALHPNKPILATASDDKTWKLWHLPHGDLIMCGEGHKDWLAGIHFHPSGTSLATGSGKLQLPSQHAVLLGMPRAVQIQSACLQSTASILCHPTEGSAASVRSHQHPFHAVPSRLVVDCAHFPVRISIRVLPGHAICSGVDHTHIMRCFSSCYLHCDTITLQLVGELVNCHHWQMRQSVTASHHLRMFVSL
jgi:hypothetical protein